MLLLNPDLIVTTLVNNLNSFSFHLHALAGAISIWIFSWLWHDFIMLKPWLRWTGMSLSEAQSLHQGKLVQDLGLYLVSKTVLAYACMLLSSLFNINNLSQALVLSLLISAGIVFPSGLGPVIFEQRHLGLWLLSSVLISISVFILLLISII